MGIMYESIVGRHQLTPRTGRCLIADDYHVLKMDWTENRVPQLGDIHLFFSDTASGQKTEAPTRRLCWDPSRRSIRKAQLFDGGPILSYPVVNMWLIWVNSGLIVVNNG